MFSFFKKIKNSGGFTLVELLATIAIMTIITSLVLAHYPRFGDKLALERTVQEIALAVREAQVYGTGILGAGGGFQAGYGVHFDTSLPNSFILFADTNGNNFYTPGEEVTTYTIETKNKIDRICINEKQGSLDCSITSMDIVYNRPKLFASMNNDGSISDTEIVVSTPNGDEKMVVVWQMGQIAVE
jgi:prepilin-type N-terminal cleavage/methylation domain-containing protein